MKKRWWQRTELALATRLLDWRRWRQPSLVRRLVLALLLAFALVWAVLVARDFADFKNDGTQLKAVHGAAKALVEVLGTLAPAEAALVAKATDTQYNRLRKQGNVPPGLGDLLFQLDSLPDGASAYTSPGLGAQRAQVNPVSPRRLALPGGAEYWAASHESPRWRVTLLAPTLEEPRALAWLASQLVEPLVIAFPLVLLPLWLAVRRGLWPLRALVAQVSRRAPDDFSPLAMPVPYAELQPLAVALDSLLARSRHGIALERAIVQDAAHELRTPLAVITAQAHALAAATHDGQRQAARAALEHAVQRASHLVHQVLTLANLEGRSGAAQQAVDLVDVSRRILVAASPRADARGMDVALDSPDRLPAVVDLVAFHSVLENLLNNALAHGRGEGRDPGRVLVQLSASPQGGVLLRVADDGPGISAEEQPHLFDRFHRGRGAQAPGAGLGLAIVRQAVARLGGSVVVGPGLDGRGVAFTVTLAATPAAGSGFS